MINIEVKREAAESSSSALRRFTKRVSGSNILRRVKGLRATERPLSHYKKQKSALKRLARRAEIARLQKLGKLPTNAPFKRYR